jgi:hypothetical protein
MARAGVSQQTCYGSVLFFVATGVKRNADPRANRHTESDPKRHLPGRGADASTYRCAHAGAKSDPRPRRHRIFFIVF